MAAIINVDKLGKRYRLGQNTAGYGRLTESLSSIGRRRRGQDVEPHPELWALRDASFEIEQGEVVGVIGRNGAGKSTLLKLLARVTVPTEGRAEIHGRVGSLLEVGTGFHQELTGRENVFLSGAILGMRRTEIQRKFDEIVAFAEIESFIDTPVKRYSSGMGLRLGFAVAAFLEPEVLLVDEVLAVGDLEFRRKCLGRINQVSTEDGRTVVFVSHDLNAILSTCSRTLLIEHGTILADDSSDAVVAQYEHQRSSAVPVEGKFTRSDPNPKYPTPIFAGARIVAEDGGGNTSHGSLFTLEVETAAHAAAGRFGIDVRIVDRRERVVTYFSSAVMQGLYFQPGETAVCAIPYLPLVPGLYSIQLIATIPGVQTFDEWLDGITFEVRRFDPFGIGSSLTPTEYTGNVVPQHEWSRSVGKHPDDQP
jgi:homopolymeric O-antigen transport system ATP-binding protein